MNFFSSSLNGNSFSGSCLSERSLNISNSGSSSGSSGSSDDFYLEKWFFIILKLNVCQICYIFMCLLRVCVKGGGMM